MGLRFRRSIKIAPGVRVNFGKKSSSISFGTRGMRHTISTTGRRTTSVGIPGSGLSYVKSSSGKKTKTKAYQNYYQIQNEEKRLQKQQQLQTAQFEVKKYENRLELIKSIHKECDDEIDWKSIYRSAPPFKCGEPGPEEIKALNELHNYKPKFFHKLLNKEEKERERLKNNVNEARKKDESAYIAWEKTVQLAKNILLGNIDAYYQVIEEMDPLGDLAEFGSGFEIGTDDSSYMEVEFDVHSSSVVPNEEMKLTKTGKLSVRPMPKTRYFELQQDYVCSCIIRIARDLFALLPLNNVIIHSYDEQLNTETGHSERILIVSVNIDRNTLNELNFDLIDCSDAMNNFVHQMHFRKTKGFAPVEKVNFNHQ